MKFYNDVNFRQLITKDACSQCTKKKIACFVTMQKGSNRISCYGCKETSKCCLRTAARRDIDYHELLPNGEASDLPLVPRVPYNSLDAVEARKALEDGLISRIPDHIATSLRYSLFSEDTDSTMAQDRTATTQVVVTSSDPSTSTMTSNRSRSTPLIDTPAPNPLRALCIMAGRALEETSDSPSPSEEHDQRLNSEDCASRPAMIDLTHPSESSSPSSFVIE
jgi:hypothetical protein